MFLQSPATSTLDVTALSNQLSAILDILTNISSRVEALEFQKLLSGVGQQSRLIPLSLSDWAEREGIVLKNNRQSLDFFDYSTFDSFNAINMHEESNPQLDFNKRLSRSAEFTRAVNCQDAGAASFVPPKIDEPIICFPSRVKEMPMQSTTLQSTASPVISNPVVPGELLEKYRLDCASDGGRLSASKKIAPPSPSTIITRSTVCPATAIPIILPELLEMPRAIKIASFLSRRALRGWLGFHKPWT